MRRATIVTLLLVSAATLAGCASPRSFNPGASLVDVLAKAGPPTDIRFDRNGDELWEYARGSEERRVGKECVNPCRSRWSPYH